MWQSCVAIEGYSIAYFDRITAELQLRAGLICASLIHEYLMNLSNFYTGLPYIIQFQFEDNGIKQSFLYWSSCLVIMFAQHVTSLSAPNSKTLNRQLCLLWMQCNSYAIITSLPIDLAEYVLNKCITQDQQQICIRNFLCSKPTVTADQPVNYNFDYLVEDNHILDWMVSQDSENWNVYTYVCVAVPDRNQILFHHIFWTYQSLMCYSAELLLEWGSHALCKRMNIWCIYEAHMSPTPSGSLVL